MKLAAQVKPGQKRTSARSAVAAVKPLNSTYAVQEEPLQELPCKRRGVCLKAHSLRLVTRNTRRFWMFEKVLRMSIYIQSSTLTTKCIYIYIYTHTVLKLTMFRTRVLCSDHCTSTIQNCPASRERT
jgi:hypothetical protein